MKKKRTLNTVYRFHPLPLPYAVQLEAMIENHGENLQWQRTQEMPPSLEDSLCFFFVNFSSKVEKSYWENWAPHIILEDHSGDIPRDFLENYPFPGAVLFDHMEESHYLLGRSEIFCQMYSTDETRPLKDWKGREVEGYSIFPHHSWKPKKTSGALAEILMAFCRVLPELWWKNLNPGLDRGSRKGI